MQPINLKIVRLAYWLIRLRWYAIIGIIFAFILAKYWLKISFPELPIFSIVVSLSFFNVLSFFFLKYLQHLKIRKSLRVVKWIINFQISTDLIILTLLLHFTGGVENPFIIYYIFHMIIGSIVLHPRESYMQTSFALLLVGLLTFLEYSGIITHYSLEGFVTSNMYNNLTYIICTGFIFISTSYFVVYITTTIMKESRKHQEAYLQANLKLRQKDKIKDEYVMRITHDIKGHITAIHSCTTVLKNQLAGPLTTQQEDFVNRANNRIVILNKFISDLLSITRRKLLHRTEKKNFKLNDALDEILRMAESSASDKKITLFKDVEPTVDLVYGEQFSIEEVLLNLVLNAIKYSPQGKPVKISVIDKSDKILIMVIDHGMGIPEEEIPFVFNEFFRASNVKNQIKDGTGLGLAISKQIIDNHGGKIWVESKLNYGTTMYLMLNKEK